MNQINQSPAQASGLASLALQGGVYQPYNNTPPSGAWLVYVNDKVVAVANTSAKAEWLMGLLEKTDVEMTVSITKMDFI
jgi:hypothetical protein